MSSRSNPNFPKKLRRVASRSKVQKRNATKKISKNRRGMTTSTVLYPTSGPLAPVSRKKARKLERLKNHARKRALEKALEQQREVQMKDAPSITKPKIKKSGEAEDLMDIS